LLPNTVVALISASTLRGIRSRYLLDLADAADLDAVVGDLGPGVHRQARAGRHERQRGARQEVAAELQEDQDEDDDRHDRQDRAGDLVGRLPLAVHGCGHGATPSG
jgi:hypothetical protein